MAVGDKVNIKKATISTWQREQPQIEKILNTVYKCQKNEIRINWQKIQDTHTKNIEQCWKKLKT